jgi:hypothetical protein
MLAGKSRLGASVYFTAATAAVAWCFFHTEQPHTSSTTPPASAHKAMRRCGVDDDGDDCAVITSVNVVLFTAAAAVGVGDGAGVGAVVGANVNAAVGPGVGASDVW